MNDHNDPQYRDAQNRLNNDADAICDILLKQVIMRAEFDQVGNALLDDPDKRKQFLLDLVLEKIAERTGD